MISVWQLLLSKKITTQVFIINVEAELIRVGSLILHPIVNIIVRDAGTSSKWYLATEVGKEIKSIMMVMLSDGQFTMQHHPVNEVRQLAEPTSDAL